MLNLNYYYYYYVAIGSIVLHIFYFILHKFSGNLNITSFLITKRLSTQNVPR